MFNHHAPPVFPELWQFLRLSLYVMSLTLGRSINHMFGRMLLSTGGSDVFPLVRQGDRCSEGRP